MKDICNPWPDLANALRRPSGQKLSVAAMLGMMYMTAGLIPPLASMALGGLPANTTEVALLVENEDGGLCGLT